MSSQPSAARVIRFGLFELDLSAGELRKQGRNIKLQDQPLQVLELLLRRPGEVVTREELQQALWPEDTFVELDQGLNTSIKKIRLALGDSADNPRFIETLPRKGYRFIAPVGERETLAPISVSTPIPAPAVSMRRWWWLAAVLLVATSTVLLRRDVGQDISRYRYTPFAMNPEGQTESRWSPDGKSVAYIGSVNGHNQVFVRSLNSAAATQLTSDREYAEAARWSPDSRRVLFFAPGFNSTDAKPTRALYSIAVVGGEPELITPMPDYSDYEIFREDLSPDNQTMAIFGTQKGGKATIFISSPLGSPYRQYEPAPFASQKTLSKITLRFSPNGKKLLLIRTGDSESEEAWLLPYPPGKSAPHRVLTHFPARKVTTDLSWLPDSRHVALALSTTGSTLGFHLWIADTESSDSYQITGGTANQDHVTVAPDGRQIIYAESKLELAITAVSLLDGKSEKLIASDVFERMPAWSTKTEKLAYVTNRNGTMEIWMRSADGSDQPLITQKDFPGNPTRVLMNPSLSPDGKRVIFTRCSERGRHSDLDHVFVGGCSGTIERVCD
jgi:Tol biopolymer transport system component/DNA-binding winged helix-turn-helix (wHTH) protein